jgi:pilus assembly protein CpaF
MTDRPQWLEPREAPTPQVPAAERLRFWTEEADAADEAELELVRRLRRRVLDATVDLPSAAREERARQLARELVASLPEARRRPELVAEVLSTLFGRLGPIDHLLRDPGVSEILVNAPDEVWVERAGRLERTAVRFRADREVRALVEGVAASVGRKFDYATPILDCHLADGSRLAAVRWPVALRGTCVAIRKFTTMPTLEEMRRRGAFPDRAREMHPSFLRRRPFPRDVDVYDFLRWVFQERLHVVVSGSTSSGKTTALNAFMELIQPGLRVVVIEDAAELQPPPELHVVRLERRPPNVEGQGEIPLAALLVAALRLRPDVIVVGECRRHETAVMLEAMSTGHDGSMTTIHADSPLDALRRMVRMIRTDFPDTPTRELRQYIASAVRVVVHMRRDESPDAEGLRVVERVSAVEGVDARGEFVVSDLYRWQGGHFLPTGHVPTWAREGETA